MTRVEEWKSLAGRILAAAKRLFETADIPQSTRDPRLVGLTLLARTVGHVEGALSEIDHKRIVEARTLTRCCRENLFWAAALAKKGDEFGNRVISDDAFSRHKRGKRLLDWSKEQEVSRDFKSKLDEFLKAEKKLRQKRHSTCSGGGPRLSERRLYHLWRAFDQLGSSLCYVIG